MNKYIKGIKHENCEVTDMFERMNGKTKKYAITVMLNRTSEDKYFKLFVGHVELKNELGHELSIINKPIDGIYAVSELCFCFGLDCDFCELQDKSVFKIVLREQGNIDWETFEYVLSSRTWKEIPEVQAQTD